MSAHIAHVKNAPVSAWHASGYIRGNLLTASGQKNMVRFFCPVDFLAQIHFAELAT
jgi:hypothetical protein